MAEAKSQIDLICMPRGLADAVTASSVFRRRHKRLQVISGVVQKDKWPLLATFRCLLEVVDPPAVFGRPEQVPWDAYRRMQSLVMGQGRADFLRGAPRSISR